MSPTSSTPDTPDPAASAPDAALPGPPVIGDDPRTPDGTPPLVLAAARLQGAGERITYRFPEAEPTELPPPLVTHLDRRERAPIPLARGPRAVVEALGEVAAPPQDLGFCPRVQAVAFMEGFLPYLPWILGRLLPWGLRFFNWLPLLYGPRRGRLTKLDRAAREAFLHRVEEGPVMIRDLGQAIFGLIKCGLYDHPKMHEALRYDPQPFVDGKVKERRERFGAPEPW